MRGGPSHNHSSIHHAKPKVGAYGAPPRTQVFARIKALLRSEAARTVEALWAAIGRLLARFPPAECARYLAHCGYAQSE